jgi:hypothetical protein
MAAALFGDADGFFTDRSLWDASVYDPLGREACRQVSRNVLRIEPSAGDI